MVTRPIRLLSTAVLVVLLAGCATVELSATEAVTVTRSALADAEVAVDDVAVEASSDGAHSVQASTADGDIAFVLDAGSGRFTSIDLAEGVDVSTEQLEALAQHKDNPADDRARQRRAVVGALVVCVAVFGGLWLARRARLREDAVADEHPV